MWVLVSYNRCLYQDGDWREDHFAELENGMLIIYAVSKTPSGAMAKITNVSADELEVSLHYEDERGTARSVILLTGSARSKELWIKYTSTCNASTGSRDVVVFESVAIKSPTKDESKSEGISPKATARKRESITGQWDALTSYMGSWHRRLFRLYQNGTIAYHEVVPVACVSLSSASSTLCVELSPKSLSGPVEMYAMTLSSSFSDVSLPKPPAAEPIPQLNQIGRRLSKAVGSFSGTPKSAAEISGPGVNNPNGQGWSSMVSAVTIGTPDKAVRDEWLKQFQQYSAWFARESLSSVSEDRRVKVITKGWAWKKGTMSFSAWKLRYFVLLSNRELAYYEAEMGREPLGVIDLRKKRSVRFSKSPDKPQGFEEIIEIETSSRTWYFSPKAMNRGEHASVCNHWLQAISDSETNYEKHHMLERETSFSFAVNSFFLLPDDFDLERHREDAIPVVTLNTWQRMTGNVPVSMLSPSPSKAELHLHGVVGGESSRRRSILEKRCDGEE